MLYFAQGVVDELCDACDRIDWKKPTPIQQQAIPQALAGKDVIGVAETGSGKTGAFALPVLQDLLGTTQSQSRPTFALVLAPTRELAAQISQAFNALGSSILLRCALVVGGLPMINQQIALAKKPHVIVATPGRLLDHLKDTKGFSLHSLKYLILDEADRMLDMDFADVLDKILKFLPRERRTMLFSATMSRKVESLQRACLRDPVRVSVSDNTHQTVATLKQSFLFIPHKYKDTYLVYLMNENAGQKTIIFCRTIYETQRLAIMLRMLGFPSVPFHGGLSQSARLGALNKFREGSKDVLVATDVAARGLDIPKTDFILNYDLHLDSKTYIHRVGRTARAGHSGHAISLVTQYDVEVWLRTEHALGGKIQMDEPDKELVMVFQARVEETQRLAKMEMKTLMEGGRDGKGSLLRHRSKSANGGSNGRKRRADDMDAEEG
jgi:ATP-dependent RNA helicase DDX47/RRP3